MKDLPKEVLWYGRKESSPEKTSLKAGKLDLIYESGSIRNIKLGDHEVIRMIYIALRDQNWGTINPIISDEKIRKREGEFEISYVSLFSQDEIQFSLEVSISGKKDNKIVFETNGEALSDFDTNRTGFCILHPIKEYLGKSCEIKSPDGKIKEITFPHLISPNLPAKNIREMSLPIAGIGKADIKFEGEVFEMEDQRNWTDDSYKTYCRPAEKPIPYSLKKGDRIQQRISLCIISDYEADSSISNNYHLSYDDEEIIPMPSIGIKRGSKKAPLAKSEIDILSKINLGFYELMVDFSGAWEKELLQSLSEAKRMKTPVKLAVLFSAAYEQEITQLVKIFEQSMDQLDAILVLTEKDHADREGFLYQVSSMLNSHIPGINIGGGTQGFFADLNSDRIISEQLDFISYSINPQVHAFDDQTIVENLAGQSATINAAKSFSNGKEIHVSPVTFKMQGGVGEDSLTTTNGGGGMPTSVDPRQMSLFGAGWTLGSIKHLSEAGAESITFFEDVGEKGLIMGNRTSQYPEVFMADKGAVFPIYYLLKEVLKDRKASLVKSVSSHPMVFEGMVLKIKGKKKIILANYSSEQINVRVDGIAPNAKVKKLDEKNMIRATYEHESYDASPYCAFQFEEPIITFKIRPFGIVFINE